MTAIQLMEQWRRHEDGWKKLGLVVMASIALGACGIWATHFTGMNALELQLDDGTTLSMSYEAGMTFLSLAAAVVGVLAGLRIASFDPFFLEMEQEERASMLVGAEAH